MSTPSAFAGMAPTWRSAAVQASEGAMDLGTGVIESHDKGSSVIAMLAA